MRKIHTCRRLLVLLLGRTHSTAAQTVITQYTYSTTCATESGLPGLERRLLDARAFVRTGDEAGAATAPKPLAGSTPETPSIVLVM